MRYLYLILLLFLSSCVEDPSAIQGNDIPLECNHLAYICCEGLYGYNNASLTRVNLDNFNVDNNFFKKVNNSGLGDTANDIIFKGDTAIIVVSTSRTIEFIHANTGQSINRVILPEHSLPRKITLVNDSIAYCTDMAHNKIIYVNTNSFKYNILDFNTGPYPEGITYINNTIIVANSGLGDYFQNLENASTLSFHSTLSNKTDYLPLPPNPVEILLNPYSEMIYAAYYHLPSKSDSIGGIVEIDPVHMRIKRQWETEVKSLIFNNIDNHLYFIGGNENNVSRLNLETGTIDVIIESTRKDDHWYALAINPYDQTIWVANARNYQVAGQILIYEPLSNNLISSFETGINPSKIIFKY